MIFYGSFYDKTEISKHTVLLLREIGYFLRKKEQNLSTKA